MARAFFRTVAGLVKCTHGESPEKLVNTRSTTWRNLSAEDKLIAEDDPAGLLITYPTLIKRPVIEAGGDVIVGWSSDTLAGLTAPE